MIKMISKIFTVFLLLMSSAVYAAEDCDKELCINLNTKEDTIVESLTMLFPSTMTTKILAGDTIYSALVSNAAEGADQVTKSVLSYFGVQVNQSAVDVYTSDLYSTETFAADYIKDSDKLIYYSFLERLLNATFNLSALACLFCIVYKIFLRATKVAYEIRQKEVLSMLIMQVPLFVILTMGLVTTDGTLALLPSLALTAVVAGALINSSLVSALAVSYSYILASDVNYKAASAMGDAEHLKLLENKHIQLSNTLAESIVLIDKTVADLVQVEAESKRPSDALFREKFASEKGMMIDEQCITGRYWHLNIAAKPECYSLREKLKLTTEALSVKYNDGINGLVNAAMDDAGFFEDHISKEVMSAALHDAVRDAYRKATARKNVICSTIDAINNPSEYEKSWFCAKFNYETGHYVDEKYYAQKVFDAVDSFSTDRTISRIRDEFQRENTISTDVLNLNKTVDALKAAIDEKMGEKGYEGIDVEVNTKNVVYAFLNVVKSLSDHKNQMASADFISDNYIKDTYSTLTDVIPTVEGQGDVVELIDTITEDCKSENCEDLREANNVSKRIFEVNTQENQLSNQDDWMDALMNKVRSVQGEDQNFFTGIVDDAKIIISGSVGFLVLSKVHEAAAWNRAMAENPNLSPSKAKKELSQAYNSVNSILSLIVLLSVCISVVAIVALALRWIVLLITCLFRLFVHLALLPIHIASFILESSDEKDDDNVFLPPQLQVILQRCFVDPIVLTVSFSIAIIMILITFKLARVMIYGISDAMIDQSSLLLFVPIILIEIAVNFMVCTFVFFKGSTFMNYAHNKLTEFVGDGLRFDSKKDVSREIKAFLAKTFH